MATIEPEVLTMRIRALLGCYRASVITDEVVAEYGQILVGLTEDEYNQAVVQAKESATDGFAPSPGEIRAAAMEIRERNLTATTPKERWLRSNPEWPEVKEFIAKLHEIAERMTDAPPATIGHSIHSGFMTDADLAQMSANRNMLNDYYIRQDLNDGLPRTKAEIEAIKATQKMAGKRK